jgi:hypothetical protein
MCPLPPTPVYDSLHRVARSVGSAALDTSPEVHTVIDHNVGGEERARHSSSPLGDRGCLRSAGSSPSYALVCAGCDADLPLQPIRDPCGALELRRRYSATANAHLVDHRHQGEWSSLFFTAATSLALGEPRTWTADDRRGVLCSICTEPSHYETRWLGLASRKPPVSGGLE